MREHKKVIEGNHKQSDIASLYLLVLRYVGVDGGAEFSLNLHKSHARPDSSSHDRVLLEVEVLTKSNHSVASHVDGFESNFALNLTGELHESDLTSFVR